MQKKVSDIQVYNAIKSGFACFKILARESLSRRWGKMPIKSRYLAGRALVYINGVAQNPEIYFSRAYTLGMWRSRVDKWTEEKNAKETTMAYYIVQSPMDFVINASDAAMYENDDLCQAYYNFCKSVQNWEYDRTSSSDTFRMQSFKFAHDIITQSQQLQSMVDIQQSNPLMRPLKRLMYSFQR